METDALLTTSNHSNESPIIAVPDDEDSPPRPPPIVVKVKPNLCMLYFNLGYALFGFAVGIITCLVFAVRYKNYHASVWGLLSGLIAFSNFFLHLAIYKKKYQLVLDHSVKLMIFSYLIILPGVSGLIAYLTLAIHYHQKLNAHSFYIAAVWSLILIKWGFTMFYHTRKYRNMSRIAVKPEFVNVVNTYDSI